MADKALTDLPDGGAATSGDVIYVVRSGNSRKAGFPDLSGFATTAQLAGKFDTPAGTTSQYIRGDGSLATFPSIPAGTVTSVGVSVPPGFSVSGSPVTSSGTIAITYASGYQGYTTAEANKLSNIEANADVTDATNVAAAGAIMTGSHAAVSVIGRSANSAGNAADIAAGANDRILARVSNALSFVQLTIGMIPDGLITAAKMASGVLTTSPSNAQTANYTLVLSDAGKTVRMSNSSARTITIPPNSSVAFPVDTVVNFETVGTGDCTIAAGSGVTIRSRNGLKLAGQYAVATAHKIGTNEWILAGDLTS